jgi:hypothetical protein
MSKSYLLILSSVRMIIFSTLVCTINDRLFEKTAVKQFIYSLHAMELISCTIPNMRQESILKTYRLAKQHICSFLFFYFLLWCLGSFNFLDREHVLVNCATTNYLLLLTSRSSQRTEIAQISDSIAKLSVPIQRSIPNGLEQVDSDVVRSNTAMSSRTDEHNIKTILGEDSSDAIITESIESEKKTSDSDKRKKLANNAKKEFPAATTNACHQIKTEECSRTIEETVSDLVFNSVPKLSFSLIFLCASSSLYLLDWGEKWQIWPIVSLFGAFIGSLSDDLIYLTSSTCVD